MRRARRQHEPRRFGLAAGAGLTIGLVFATCALMLGWF